MSWYDWDAERAAERKKNYDPGQIGFNGPFLFGLSGYRGEYARLYPKSGRLLDGQARYRAMQLLREEARLSDSRRRREEQLKSEAADEFNTLLGGGR